MSIQKHDDRLLDLVHCGKRPGYKFLLVDPGDPNPVRIPLSVFKIKGESTLNIGITAQSLISINQPFFHYGTGTLTENRKDYEAIDLNKLVIPNSVTKGDDGYYSVDYSKLDYTFQQFKSTLVSTLCLPN